MKRSTEALLAAAAAALALAAAATAAHAVSPVVKLSGDARLTHGAAAARFHVHASFATDTPGAPLFTVQRAVILFPDHAGTNGRRFRSCSAAQIERFHGNVGRCSTRRSRSFRRTADTARSSR